jgi:hypothetical protein
VRSAAAGWRVDVVVPACSNLASGVAAQDYIGVWTSNRLDVENNLARGHSDSGADGSMQFYLDSDVTFKGNGAPRCVHASFLPAHTDACAIHFCWLQKPTTCKQSYMLPCRAAALTRASAARSYMSSAENDDVENNKAGYYMGMEEVTNSVVKNNKAGANMYISSTDSTLTIESNTGARGARTLAVLV